MFIMHGIFMQDAINFNRLILDKDFLQIAASALSHRDSEMRMVLILNRDKNLDKIR